MAGAHLEVRKINCTQCAAPLELYGGHKVETITCSYCGSVLDPHEEYAVLKAHRQAEDKRRFLPLKIGMRGNLWEVEFTVIGLITYQDGWDRWTDFCLFSPTHGYVWLTWDRGHFVLSRRERDLPMPGGDWSKLATQQSIWLGAREYQFYEAFAAEVEDVAGELPWRAEVGDKGWSAEAIAPPHVLSQERNGSEIEYYTGEYVAPAVIQKAFKLTEDLPQPKQVYPSQPFIPNPFNLALGGAGLVWGGVALVLLLAILIFGGGRGLLEQSFTWGQISGQDGVQTRSFQVTDADQLLKLKLRSQVDNGWMWLDIDLTQRGDGVFSIGKEISYYHGVEGGESWSEGSRSATALFKVPAPGTYEFTLQASERGGYRSQTPVSVEVRQGVVLMRWFIGLVVLMAIAAIWPYWRKQIFEHKRWAPAMEDEDDDD